jgi:muconolactone delta-isomerase
VFVYGAPIPVPAAADRDAMDRLRAGLQAALERLTAEAEARARGVWRFP